MLQIFEPNDPLVLNGTYDIYGYTAKERRALERRARHAPHQAAERTASMFTPDTPMTLQDVTFTTEVVDEETRRIVVCKFAMAPFTAAQAEALNVRSLLFDGNARPKQAIETVVLNIDIPLQRLTFAMAPDQQERRIVFPNVKIHEKLSAKVKRDREVPTCEATIKLSFHYPSADELLYVANGVNDTHYLTFDTEQGNLLTSTVEEKPRKRGRAAKATDAEPAAENGDEQPTEGDLDSMAGSELRPGVHAEH